MSSVSQRKRTSAKTDITLRGSTEIVTDFFYYAVNSILYQRGIYHPDSFIREAKYDIITLVTTDEGLKNYLQNVIEQLKGWLMDSELQRLVLVVVGKDSGETLERWTFSVHKEDQVVSDNSSEPQAMAKSKKDVTRQIKEVIRQITASVTFLPMIDEPCSFDLLVYTDNDAKVPTGWDESDPKCIEDSSEVKLRSFSTKEGKRETRRRRPRVKIAETNAKTIQWKTPENKTKTEKQARHKKTRTEAKAGGRSKRCARHGARRAMEKHFFWCRRKGQTESKIFNTAGGGEWPDQESAAVTSGAVVVLSASSAFLLVRRTSAAPGGEIFTE